MGDKYEDQGAKEAEDEGDDGDRNRRMKWEIGVAQS